MTLHAYTSFSGGSIACYKGDGPLEEIDTTPVLEDGVVVESISANMDERLRFKFPVDPLTESVECSIGGGSGDADLYVSTSPVNFESPGVSDVSMTF